MVVVECFTGTLRSAKTKTQAAFTTITTKCSLVSAVLGGGGVVAAEPGNAVAGYALDHSESSSGPFSLTVGGAVHAAAAGNWQGNKYRMQGMTASLPEISFNEDFNYYTTHNLDILKCVLCDCAHASPLTFLLLVRSS